MRNLFSIVLGIVWIVCGLLGPAAAEEIKFTNITLTAKADLGEATFTYHMSTAKGSLSVGMQLYAHRDDITQHDQWDTITPTKPDGAPLIITLAAGTDSSGKFTLPLKRGTYGKFRLLLFESPDSKAVDFGKLVYDSARDAKLNGTSLNLTIKTESRRVKTPTLYLPDQIRDIVLENDGSYTVTISGSVKIPATYTTADKGMWVMTKGDAGFAQVWCGLDNALSAGNAEDAYRIVPFQLVLNNLKIGLYNMQFGLFKQSFGDPIQWVFPGVDFETGGDQWVIRARPESIPPRLRVRNHRFVTLSGQPYDFYAGNPSARSAVGFIRGGNYGNRVCQVIKPALDTPAYFKKLEAIGCRYMRVNFNQDRYPREPVYEHAIDQIVNNIWAAGMYPILCPQDLPDGNTLEEQAQKGLKVVEALATKYKGKSVWLEICNEPHAFGTWIAWKPVAIRYVRAIRNIDPDAFVIVPFEGLQKDGREAAKDPITEAEAHVDLYDGHAYVAPETVDMLFGPAIRAGLPVLIGEYGGGADYLAKMDSAFEKLPAGLMALGPWAFTIPGEDSLPLVSDGQSDPIAFTPAGQIIATDYAAWNHGKKRGN